MVEARLPIVKDRTPAQCVLISPTSRFDSAEHDSERRPLQRTALPVHPIDSVLIFMTVALSAADCCYSSVVWCNARPGSEKDITEVSGTSGPGSIPGRGKSKNPDRIKGLAKPQGVW
jgi:hypothetical protein